MFHYIVRIFRNKLFNIKNRKKFITINSNCDVYNTIFEGKNSIADRSNICNCVIGYGSYISHDSDLRFTKIGRFCSIADHVYVSLGNHPLCFVTMHPSFYYDTTSQIGFTFHRGEPLYDNIYKYPYNERFYQVIIGNDVWIGSHVLILGGVTIGDGAVIAAGAVVVEDVAPYSIVGGCPAKSIKKRFSPDIINKLLNIEWWNEKFATIEENYRDYLYLKDFLEKYEKC